MGEKGRIGTNGGSFDFKAQSLNSLSDLSGFNLSGFSSHADATQLIQWLEKTKSKYVFLVHGENYSREMLKQMIAAKGLCEEKNIFTPALLEEYDLTNLHSAHNSVLIPDKGNLPVANSNGRIEITLLGHKVFLPSTLVNLTEH